jgi:thiamine-phosphate pyrophosphorylase
MELAEQAFRGGVTALQLREKTMEGRAFYELAVSLAKFCRQRGKLFIINDRLDMALAVGADGVHLGQTDLPAEAALRIMPPEMILGVSASNFQEAREAEKAGADYVGVGAMFATDSKTDAKVVSADQAAEIVKLDIISVAIGGVGPDQAGPIWRMGFDGLAVISALTGSKDPEKTAQVLLEAKG